MDKYTKLLEDLPFDLLHIAQSYANDNKSPKIEPAHLFRALLHKSAGLVNFIEDTLDEDYYYLVDWVDMRIQQCDKSPYTMKGIELSHNSETVVKEAMNLCEKYGLEEMNAICLLASLVTSGIGFTYEQLKTLPLKPEKVLSTLQANGTSNPVKASINNNKVQTPSEMGDYFGKTSLIHGILQRIRDKKVPASLEKLQPFELDLIAISQGVSYKGEIEDRFKTVTNNLMNVEQPLLVIENFHRVEDKQSVLNGLLPAIKKLLSKNQMQFLYTTTTDGYTKDIEKDEGL